MAATTTTQQAEKILDDEALAEDDLLDELESDEIPSHIREARIAQFKEKNAELLALKDQDHGLYKEILEEREFLEITTAETLCVVHFFHADFRRCDIMHTHLLDLSKKYFETKFAKMNVDKAKFFVEKLKIRVLPALICFKKGIVCDRVVGFDELGNTDSFQTRVLEKRLARAGVIDAGDVDNMSSDEDETESRKGRSIFGNKAKEDSDDDDNDW